MTILEGTLSKWTNVMKGWQYRWFVLDENAGLLSYYTSKEKMVKGVRRGCVRLKGAVIGIDDQDVNTFTITVDHKTFHFQAMDADEREKWVRRLEDTILRHASRIRGISDTYCSVYGQSNETTKRPDYLQTLDKRVSEADAYLQLMIEQTAKIEQKLAAQQQQLAQLAPQAAQNSSPQNSLDHSSCNNNNSNQPLAAGAGNQHSVSNSSIGNSKYDETNRRIQDNANAMLDSIKHSIVLLQIAKNTAHPINGIYHGPSAGLHMKSSGGGSGGGGLGGAGLGNISGTDLAGLGDELLAPGVPLAQSGSILYGAECLEKGGSSVGGGGVGGGGGVVQLFVPETSYSSSEGEDDFFDANDDPYSSEGKANTLNNRAQQQLSQDAAGSGKGPDGGGAASGVSGGSYQLQQSAQGTMATGGGGASANAASSAAASSSSAATGRKASHVSFRHDGSLDYDALYEDECESDLSMESHGNVMTHLLSQVKIGMDLTKVVLPTFILERRSLLEMYADYFAHPDLFLKIVDQKDPRDRMVQVVRWYLSAYHAGRKSAVAKKPYNPIIGEVFRCHWDIPELSTTRSATASADDGFGAAELAEDGPIPWCRRDQLTFIAEQVSHHPPISAFYAEHCTKRISFAAHVWTKSKFLGLSIGVHNIGQGIVALPDHNEEYILTFPNGYGRSILTVPWIELGGTVTVTCPQTGYHADIDFLTKPFYGGKRNRIAAEVYAPNEKKSFLSVSGEWSGSMEAKWAANSSDGGYRQSQSQRGPEVFVDVNSIPIFKKHVRPIAEQDEFESRNIWKEVTAGLRLNDIERATNAKSEVEQKQRDEAKGRKDTNAEWETKYFKPVGDGWIYTKSLSQRLLDAKR